MGPFPQILLPELQCTSPTQLHRTWSDGTELNNLFFLTPTFAYSLNIHQVV